MTTAQNHRAAVTTEALTWMRTPWHHAARVKGAGVDCAQFLLAVFSACGLIPEIKIDDYPPDWHLHRDEQRFMAHLLAHADQVTDPEPGDIAMFRYGRHAAHGSIVLGSGGPTIIHAWRDEGMVTLTNLSVSPLLDRLVGYYRLRGLE